MILFRSIISVLALAIACGTVNAQTVAENCGCEDKTLPAVIAMVNNVKISAADLDAPLDSQLKELRKEVVEARKAELDLQINSLLLEAEAKKRGITTAQLLKLEVEQKVTTPTEAEAQEFYNQNKGRIASDFATVKQDIIDYLRGVRERDVAKELATRLRAAGKVRIDVPVATPPSTDADRSRVFAVVNGKNITSGDIEESLRPLIFSVQQQMYSLRKSELELKINDLLLEAEAKKRNTTAQELLADLNSKVRTVSEEDALKFFNENKDRINSDFASVKPQIIEYLIQQDKDKRMGALAEQLRRDAAIQVFLNAPQPPVYKIATDDQPERGNSKAAVTLIEFTDYQCPSCAQQHPILERLVSEFGDRVRFVIRDFPLTQHKQAWKAAEAAEAAREQGKYWEFVGMLYTRQAALESEKLKQYATELGLDRAKFDAALDSGKFSDKVQRDVFDGQRVGVNSTPSLFLNGRPLSDRSYEALKAAIEAALKKPA